MKGSMSVRSIATVAALLISSCAPTTGIDSLPVEVLVVLDQGRSEVLLVPVDSTNIVNTFQVGGGDAVATSLAVRGDLALIGFFDAGLVQVVDLSQRLVLRTIQFGEGNVSAVAFGSDGTGYVANRDVGLVSAFDVRTGNSLALHEVRGGPQGFGEARGRLFVVAGNRANCAPGTPQCASRPSWLRAISPTSVGDSIGLFGPGNAGPATSAPDGLLYVLHQGDGPPVDGRLSVVDPVANTEIGSFGGFGPLPRWLTSDGGDRILIVSSQGGLMTFNSRERRVERGLGAGIPLSNPSGLSVDALGRIYVTEQQACTPASPGRVRVFGPDLVERPGFTAGACPVAAVIAEIPASALFETSS
jgi:hypothetical protein